MTDRSALDERLARILADALVRELRAEDDALTGERPDTVTSGAGRVPTRARKARTDNAENTPPIAPA
jgi:hypothetical protein